MEVSLGEEALTHCTPDPNLTLPQVPPHPPVSYGVLVL